MKINHVLGWIRNKKQYMIAMVAILTVFSIALVVVVAVASIRDPIVYFPTTTINYNECFDLDTGKVTETRLPTYCLHSEWDIVFNDGIYGTPIIQDNWDTTLAYTDEPYDAITQSSIKSLTFANQSLDTPFDNDHVAIIHTAEGHYYKMRLIEPPLGKIRFGYMNQITFQWDKLQ